MSYFIKNCSKTMKTETYFSENTAFSKPTGVATDKTTTDMPKELRHTLPDIEELKKLL